MGVEFDVLGVDVEQKPGFAQLAGGEDGVDAIQPADQSPKPDEALGRMEAVGMVS